MKIKVRLEELKGRDLVAMEEKGGSVIFLRSMLARFMVDENGQRVEEKKVNEYFDNLTAMEVRELGRRFVAEIKRAMNEAVDPLAEES